MFPKVPNLAPFIAFQAVINNAAVGGTAHYLKYVDDLTFAENRHSSELSNLQGDLDDFLDWSFTNQLKLNRTKCQALQIYFMRDPSPHPDLKIGQSVLAFVSTAKVLGVWLQNDLKWDTQVNYINKNVVKRLSMLRSLKRIGFDKSELVTVHKGYIRPLLKYSDVIWHSRLTSNQTHQLEGVQKRALRIILGTDYIPYGIMLWMCVMLIVYLPGGNNIV